MTAAAARVGAPRTREYRNFPRLRYMGSKHRLLPWIESVLSPIEFESALDAFSGSGCVSYLLKVMGKRVHANDFLSFARDLAQAAVVNSAEPLTAEDVAMLTGGAPRGRRIIQTTVSGIFFTDGENR